MRCRAFLMRYAWWMFWTRAIRLICPWWSARTWGWRWPSCTAGLWRTTASVCSWMQTPWWEKYTAEALVQHFREPKLCWLNRRQWRSLENVQVLSNVDELFEREELSAAPDPGWPDCFNTGVFVFRPSNETYEKLLQFCSENGSFDGETGGLFMKQRREVSFEMPHVKRGRSSLVCLFAQLHIIKGKKKGRVQ